MVARVADGETSSLPVSDATGKRASSKTAGTSGGWFGRSTVVTKKHVELVVLLTPRIVPLP